MANSRTGGRVGVASVALLVLANCGGQTTRSGEQLEATDGGSENGGSENDPASDEAVVVVAAAQAVTSTSSGGDGGSGAGGTDGIGVAGAGALAGTGGAASALVTTGWVGTADDPIDWGDVPVPEGCPMTGRFQTYSDSCDLLLYCSGRQISVGCSLDGNDYRCGCSGASDWSSFQVYGVSPQEACLYAVNACLRSDAFEEQPFYCDVTSQDYSSERCNSIRECSRVAAVADIKLSEFIRSDVACSMGGWGFDCECARTTGNVRFEGTEANRMLPCDDAHDWCGGDNLELTEDRSCSATPEPSFSGICTTHLDCQQRVLVSGMEATMFDTVPVQCYEEEGPYACACPSLSLFAVDAPDLDSACVTAADLCAGEQ